MREIRIFRYDFTELISLKPAFTAPPSCTLQKGEFRKLTINANHSKEDARCYYRWRHATVKGGSVKAPPHPGAPLPTSFVATLFASSAPPLSPLTSTFPLQEVLSDTAVPSEYDDDFPAFGYFEVAVAMKAKLPVSGSPARISEPLYPKMAIRTISPDRLRAAMTPAEFSPFSLLWDSKFSSLLTVPPPKNPFRN